MFAGGDHRVVFPRIVAQARFLGPFDKLIGVAGHRRYDDGATIARVDLALDVRRHIANLLNVGDGCPAKFHHQ